MARRSHAARRVHDGLVGARALVGTAYLDDPALRRAYAEDIAPRTEAALARIFAAAEWRGGPRVRRALDLGAGTGAASRAVRARFGDAVEIVGVDRSPGGPGVVVADVTRAVRPPGVDGRFDLVVAAHLLNELVALSIEARARLVSAWCDELLAPGGRCVLVEPALRDTSRALLETRDLLVGHRLFVRAPCLGQGPCPALVRARDWCHDSAPSAAPGRGRTDFSYLVLAREPPRPVPASWFRVVSDPLFEKGRLRVFGCGPDGRHALVRLDRDRTPANESLDAAERGGIVTVEGARAAADGLRVGQGTAVTMER